MNSLAIFAFFAVLAAVSAGLVAPGASVLQGPSSRTTAVGPDGSVISSFAPGGQVVAHNFGGVVAHTAPVVASYAAPGVVAHAAYAAPYAAPYASPYVAHGVYF